MKRLLLVIVLLCALAFAGSAAASQRIYLSGDVSGGSGVRGFELRADGGIGAPIPGAAVAGGSGSLGGLSISPEGTSLIAADFDDGVLNYAIAADGSLTPQGAFPDVYKPRETTITPIGAEVYASSLDSSGIVTGFKRAFTGQLTEFPTGTPASDTPSTIASAPDQPYVYVASGSTFGEGLVTYRRQVDGTLTRVDAKSANPASSVVVAPDGLHLYVVDAFGVNRYDIGADGIPVLHDGMPFDPGGTGPAQAAISADGTRLYVGYAVSKELAALRIDPDGSLSSVPGSPVDAGSGVQPNAVELNAGGTRLYVSDDAAARTAVYSIDADGLPTPLADSPFATGVQGGFASIALTPHVGPTADFTTVVNNRRVTFNGARSSSPDGSIAHYDWEFSNGESLMNGGREVATRFGKNPPEATLTVTDDAGCSQVRLSDGHTLYCAPTYEARTTGRPFAPKFFGDDEQGAKRTIRLRMRCPVDCKVKVVGRVKLSGKGVRAKKTKILGTTARLEAGKKTALKLKVSKRGKGLIADSTRAVARLKVAVTNGDGDLFKQRHGIKLVQR